MTEQNEKYGLFKGLSQDTYHNELKYISNSGLKVIHQKSLAHFYYKFLDPEAEKQEITDAMRFGRAFHTLLLEPDNFQNEVVLWSGLPRNRKEGKADYEAACAMLKGDMILMKQDEYDQARSMADSILNLKTAAKFITTKGEPEATLLWHDEVYEVDCKARVDFITEDGFLIDIKTATDASHDAFRKQSFNLMYYMQAAYYMRAYEAVFKKPAKGFCFIVVEKEPPYVPAVYYATEDELMLGHYHIEKNLEKYSNAIKNKHWQGYPDKFVPLGLPPWGEKILDEGDES